MKSNSVIGIDGCKGGWMAAISDYSLNIRIEVFKDLNLFWSTHRQTCTLLLIDMPIGFISRDTVGRECDRLARKILSPHRHSSVFTPPCRTALYASPSEASQLNFKYTGKRLSRQIINIFPKMKAIDRWIRQLTEAERRRIKESHPEVVFAVLNDQKPMLYSKKKVTGRSERLDLLRKYLPSTDELLTQTQINIPRTIAQVDDLLDALVLMLAGVLSVRNPDQTQTLPATPPLDDEGVPMQIFYFAGKPR